MPAPIPAADAIATLRAAGHCVTRTTRADAARRYGCQTALYVVDGRGVNLGRLRELATLAQAEPAPVAEPAAPEPVAPAPLSPAGVVALLCQKFPVSTPATYQPAVARLQARGAVIDPVTVLREMNRPVLPGEVLPPEPPAWPAPEVTLPPVAPRQGPGVTVGELRQDALTGDALAGQPWDPGTPDARARVALQGERVGILWPVAQALRGEGVALPPSWANDGPVMAGELTLTAALARLPLGAIAQAAAALAALPPVTAAQDAALALCRTGAVPGRPYL